MPSELHSLKTVIESRHFNRFVQAAQRLIGEDPNGYAVVSLDICDFKLVNLTLGYDAGNRILSYLYLILNEMLGPGELAIQDKADIFYLLLKTQNHRILLERLNTLRAAKDEIVLTNLPEAPYLEMRCGIYLTNEHERSVPHMVECANMARKHATGNFSFGEQCFYDSNYAALKLEEKERTALLLEALDKEEFEIFLQPKVSIRDHSIVGAEALARWRHPELGMVLPGQFVSILESFHLIHRLDLIVFKRVCELIAHWQSNARIPFPLSLNLSCQSIENPLLMKRMCDIADQFDIPRDAIEIEITESCFCDNDERVVSFLKGLKSAGFRCAIDDFGSGYSSLGNLKKVPFDTIKMDRSFFTEGDDEDRADMIVRCIMSLANKLGAKTVAEGIETPRQLERLSRTHCDQVQGFLFYHPMSAKDFESLAYSVPSTPTL